MGKASGLQAFPPPPTPSQAKVNANVPLQVLLTLVSYRKQVRSVTTETAAAVGKGREAEEWAETGIFQLWRQTLYEINRPDQHTVLNVFGVTE